MSIEMIGKIGTWQNIAKQADQQCVEASFPSADRAVFEFDCHANLERLSYDEMITKINDLVLSNVSANIQLNLNIDLDAGEDGYLLRVKFKENDGRNLGPYAEILQRIANAIRMQVRTPENSMGIRLDLRIN